MKRFVIMTDLEGVAGTDSFSQTRTKDLALKGPSMKQLAKEVNACMKGIRSVFPDARIDVLDGHGSGGLIQEDLDECHFFGWEERRRLRPHSNMEGATGMLFIGQHAMAGTIDAPLNHTFSSTTVMYYRLNDTFIGEFGALALIAGLQSVPTIFLSGDDKACLEAKMFIPEIETATTKYGKGLESAIHLESSDACDLIYEGTVRAMQKTDDISPYVCFQPPYHFEVRFYEPLNVEERRVWENKPNVVILDERTYQVVTNNLSDLPF